MGHEIFFVIPVQIQYFLVNKKIVLRLMILLICYRLASRNFYLEEIESWAFLSKRIKL